MPHPVGEEKGELAEERVRLEWITPEHLKGSPLCPLHERYIGLSKGVCVYHGRLEAESPGRESEKEVVVDDNAVAVMGEDGGEDRNRMVRLPSWREGRGRRESVAFGDGMVSDLQGGVGKSRRTRAEAVSST